MKGGLFDLKRTLYKLETDDWADASDDLARAAGKLVGWDEVLKERCSVIIGTANSGKTSELKRQAGLLREKGRHACFIEVRSLVTEARIEDAFEPIEEEAFKHWSDNSSEPLCLFVDSIDEGALERARDLKTALRKLVRHVGAAPGGITWVLSTRPAALNAAVVKAIADGLGIPFPLETSVLSRPASLDKANGLQTAATPNPASGSVTPHVVKFRLSNLTSAQAGVYLERKYGLKDHGSISDAAYAHGLASLLTTPGKLDLLQALDLLTAPPSNLQEVFSRCVALHIDAPANDRKDIAHVPAATLEHEVARLACASSLCERLNIEMPSDGAPATALALSARTVIRGLLDPAIRYLLSCSLFEDSGHHQVKLQPDDFRFFLAARRLNELIQSRDDAKKVADILCWQAPTGETGVFALFIPVAGWLATFNHYFFLICVELDPQCAAFFGDLRTMPPMDAKRALGAAIAKIAQGERPGHGAYVLTSENYWQAGAPFLQDEIGVLFDINASNEDATDILLEISRVARLPILREKVLKVAENDYARLLANHEALRYLIEVGNDQDRISLRNAALGESSLSERTVRMLLQGLAWRTLDANDIANLTEKCDGPDSKYMLRYSLTEEIVSGASDQQLYELTDRLLTRVIALLPADADESARTVLDDFEWLAEAVASLLASLATRDLAAGLVVQTGALIVRFQLEILGRDDGGIDVKDLKTSLTNPGQLRSDVIRRLSDEAGSDESKYWDNFVYRAALLRPTASEAEIVGADGLIAVIKVVEANAQQQQAPKKAANPRRPVTATAANRKQLEKRIEAIRAGTDIAALSWVAQVLSNAGSLSRYGDVSISGFRLAYGDEIADATLEGLSNLWRREPPKRDETQPRSIYMSTVAGLQGLGLEMQGPSEMTQLTSAEVVRALDYGLYELNGLPKWYWSVALCDVEAAQRYLAAAISDAGAGPVARERAAKILTSLADAPDDFRKSLAPLAWSAAKESKTLDDYQLKTVLSLVTTQGLVSPEEFSRAAAAHALDEEESGSGPAWAAAWLLYAPEAFMMHLLHLRALQPADVDKQVLDLATYLDDNHELSIQELSKKSPATIVALRDLYCLLCEVLPREGDTPRPSGKAYALEARDRAQRLRDRLPPLIASASNAASHAALVALAARTSSTDEARYLLFLARRNAEAMLRVPPMSAAGYLDFERTLERVHISQESFAQTVESAILDIKEIVEKGDFSPRRFLSTFFSGASSSVMRSREDDFQLFLANELALIGARRFSVTREGQLAEDTRRDISIHHSGGGWQATLELKVSMGDWTLQEYRDSLKNQLVGLYMKELDSKAGFFVVLLQKNRQWDGPNGRLGFNELLGILREDALQLQAENPTLRLRVIGIDATEPVTLSGTPVRAKSRGKIAKPRDPVEAIIPR
jgi:hypothetical protein